MPQSPATTTRSPSRRREGEGSCSRQQQCKVLQKIMSSSHAGAAWPPVPPPEGVWRQLLALPQAEQLQHMQHKQLQQQQQNEQLLQQLRWEQQHQYKPLMRPPGMPEWDKTKAPGVREWDKWDKGRAAAPHVSGSCQLQLPTWSKPQRQLPTLSASCCSKTKQRTCLSTLSSPTLTTTQQLKNETVTEYAPEGRPSAFI